jgi:hypothetical protein
MRICRIALLAAGAVLLGQSSPQTKDDRKQKARELLEKVDTSLGALGSEVNVIALAQLGGAWKPLDPGRATTYLRQAFAAAAALPDDSDRPVRSKMQAEIVKLTVDVNLAEACELLHGMPSGNAVDARNEAADRVVQELIGKKEFDRAMEVLALTPADSDYPFAAAQRLFEELPKDDSRRVLVFGNAAAAYRRRPGDAFRTFLAKHWKEVPREMAQAALGTVVNTILDREDEPGNGESLETAKGTVKLASRKSMDLFDILGLIRALDPGRYKILEDQYADLRDAAQKFPDGRQSVDTSGTLRTVARKKGDESSSGSSYNDSDDDDSAWFAAMPPMSMFDDVDAKSMQDTIRAQVAAKKKVSEAWAAFKKDHNRGISLADDIPIASMRAATLIHFADETKKDAAGAKNLISKAAGIVGDIPDVRDRFWPLMTIANTEHDLHDDKASWNTLEQARDSLMALYKSDTNADKPNKAMREFWPSTFACRTLMYGASKCFGTRGEELLESLPGPDLVVMAQIELARAWLGASVFDSEHGSMSWNVVH